jgi:GxxExxY protein
MKNDLRLDIWVEQRVIVEVKAIEHLTDVHLAQLITYLRITDNKLGLLINFNVKLLKQGIKRVALGLK